MKVCPHCFNDLELKQFIISSSIEKGKCDYCINDIDSELLDINELLDFFAEFLQLFRADPHGIPLTKLIQKDWDIFTEKSIAQNILSEILATINCAISNSKEKVVYVEEIIENAKYWEILKDELKWKRRFLTNIDRLEELGWFRFFDQQITLPESIPLFRARLHHSGDQEAFKSDNMGCPSQNKSTSGRANPQGIPYLYLCKDIETTLYETRATYLDEISIGTFVVKSDIEVILVDFTDNISAFLNMGNIVEYTKSVLLKKHISFDLSKPMRRYDSELEYIPTQFICEFIRYITNADGILFNSSLHKGGKNIVLFQPEKVECIKVVKHRVNKVDIKGKQV